MKTTVIVEYMVASSVEQDTVTDDGPIVVQIEPGGIGRVKTQDRCFLYANVIRIRRFVTPGE